MSRGPANDDAVGHLGAPTALAPGNLGAAATWYDRSATGRVRSLLPSSGGPFARGPRPPMNRGISIVRCGAALALCGSLVGCVAHPARPAFRASVFIGDRGISIPLPPPSILKAPKQKVDVDAEIVGDEAVAVDLLAHVVDLHGDAEVSVEVPAGQTGFLAEGLEIDLTDNCLDVWLAGVDGGEGEHALYTASVVVDGDHGEVIVVSAGCDDD